MKLDGVKADNLEDLRKDDIFRREYALCYNFCSNYHDEKGRFVVVRFRDVLLYCMLKWLMGKFEEVGKTNVSC